MWGFVRWSEGAGVRRIQIFLLKQRKYKINIPAPCL